MDLKTSLFILIGALIPCVVFASNTERANLDSVSDWYQTNRFELSIQDDQNNWTAHWLISLDINSNTIKIEKNDYFLDQNIKGSLIILLGKVMLSNGLILKRNHEIDAVDTPVIMLQLLLNLLYQSVPKGPQTVGNELTINHTELTTPIRVTTKSASAFFNTPWSVSGTLSKGPQDVIAYDLKFNAKLDKGAYYLIKMNGKLHQEDTAVLENTMNLEGWEIYDIGPYSHQANSKARINYGASKSFSKAKTLGELRQELE